MKNLIFALVLLLAPAPSFAGALAGLGLGGEANTGPIGPTGATGAAGATGAVTVPGSTGNVLYSNGNNGASAAAEIMADGHNLTVGASSIMQVNGGGVLVVSGAPTMASGQMLVVYKSTDASSAAGMWYINHDASKAGAFCMGDTGMGAIGNQCAANVMTIFGSGVPVNIVPNDAATTTTFDASGVTTTGGFISTGGPFHPLVRTKAQMDGITPAVGDYYTCSDCAVPYDTCVGTAATLSGFRAMTNSAINTAVPGTLVNKGCGTGQ